MRPHSPKKIRLTYSQYVELGRKFKLLEQLTREITETLSAHVHNPLATSFRKKAEKAAAVKSCVENFMIRDVERAGQQLPQDWGLAFYGGDHPEIEHEHESSTEG